MRPQILFKFCNPNLDGVADLHDWLGRAIIFRFTIRIFIAIYPLYAITIEVLLYFNVYSYGSLLVWTCFPANISFHSGHNSITSELTSI